VVSALAAIWRLLLRRILRVQTRGIGELDFRTKMNAAWYEKQGAARDVLIIGEMADPQLRTGEVRIRVAFSCVNPGDEKKREDAFGVGMPYPRVIPHTNGSRTVDAVAGR
jgi:hypothetical protein